MVGLLVLAGLVVAWPRRPGRCRLPAGRPPATRTRGGDGVRRWIVLALAAVLATVLSPLVGFAVLVGLWGLPRLAARRAAARRRTALLDGLPEAADLLALSVAGGLTVPMAMVMAARWSSDPFDAVMTKATAEMELGRSTAEALEDVAVALGPPARPLVDALLASERYGVALGDSLDRVAREARLERRRRSEERARRVPVLLLFPLVLCVLPAFGFLTVVPLLVGSLPDLPG